MLLIRQSLSVLVSLPVLISVSFIQNTAYAASELQQLVYQRAEKSIADQQISPADQTADELIDDCWALSSELRESGSTPDMREGLHITTECLKDAILDQVEVLFNPEVLSRADAQIQLDNIQEHYAGFYWNLYNSNRRCFCGTIEYLRPEYANLLESILRDAIDVRNGG